MRNKGEDFFWSIFNQAMKLPGVKVDRRSFLTEVFQDKSNEMITKILEVGPVSAGCTRAELEDLANKLISKRTSKSSLVSFASGLPSNMLVVLGTTSVDVAQFYGFTLKLAQEIAYLYGIEDLWVNGNLDKKKIQNQLILYLGVMFGISEANSVVKTISSSMAQKVLKKLPQMSLTKSVIYRVVKKIAQILGYKMTKEVFAKGVSKCIPVVGGAISGGMTWVSMRKMGFRLANVLDEANFSYTEKEFEADWEDLTGEEIE